MQVMLNIPDSLLNDALRQAINNKNEWDPLAQPKEWLNKSEMASYLNVSRVTLDKLIKDGLPCVDLGGVYRISKHEVNEWLSSRANPSQDNLKLVK